MVAYLEKHNDPRIVTETIDDGEGEIINCVDIHLQHGFDAPIGSFSPPPPKYREPPNVKIAPLAQAYGTVNKQCPVGTVPQVRLSLEFLESFGTLEAYLKPPVGPTLGSTDFHQYALVNQVVANEGAFSELNVWHSNVAAYGEFSLSQQWASKGNFNNGTGQTVEAGVIVYPAMFGDYLTRLFIFMTPDAYGTLCWNFLCSNFVQIDYSAAIGGYFPTSATSQWGGTQLVVPSGLIWWSGDWWFYWNGRWLGYWPASNFTSAGLLNGASMAQFGGEITNLGSFGGSHTATDMGAGYFYYQQGYAAYHANMQYALGYSWYPLALPPTSGSGSNVTDTDCYNASWGTGHATLGSYIFFGGPGYNAYCE